MTLIIIGMIIAITGLWFLMAHSVLPHFFGIIIGIIGITIIFLGQRKVGKKF